MALLQSESARKWEEKVAGNPVLSFLFSHVALAFFYGIFLFLYEIKFLRELVPAVHPVLIAWAGLILLYDLVIRRFWKRVPLWQILGLFFAAAALTAVTNLGSGLIVNAKAFVMTTLPLFAFYPVCLLSDADNRKKAFLTALLGAAIVMFLSSLAAILTYLLRINATVEWMGITEHIGYRLYDLRFENSGIIVYGFNKDTNHSAAYAMAFALYSGVLWHACRHNLYATRRQNQLGKIFAIANLVVQALYWPLANSRGGWVALYAVGGLLSFVWLFRRLRVKKTLWKTAAAAVSAVAVVVVLSFGLTATRSLTASLSSVIGHSGIVTILPGESDEDAPVEEDGFDKVTGDLSAGRLDLWKEAFTLFADSPFVGNGPGNNAADAKANGNCPVLATGKAVHNSYLDLLLNYGILGTVLMFGFFLGAVLLIGRQLRERVPSGDPSFYLTAAMVLVMLMSSFLLSSLFINTTATAFLVFLTLGYCVSGAVRPAKD